MELDELRRDINDIDSQIQELFTKRMELCCDVAEYKIKNNIPVFQSRREEEILNRVSQSAPDELKGGTRVLFQTLMDISKCRQYQKFFAEQNHIEYKKLDLSGKHTVAVPGISGSYTHDACSNVFEEFEPMFFEQFEDVFRAVEHEEAEFGILPIVNSTAGSVGQTYELLKRYDLKICACTKLKISHCLAARKGTQMSDIKIVYSHEQALSQCSNFIAENGFKAHKYTNTSTAACFVVQAEQPYGAICSVDCANKLGLDILKTDIANAKQNYTKFIIISKETLKSENADTISVSLALPHQSSALYRMLTKFSVAGLNLSMIESMPIANTDFDVVFYLDFQGAIDTPEVAKLMSELSAELSYFKFLGNYEEM